MDVFSQWHQFKYELLLAIDYIWDVTDVWNAVLHMLLQEFWNKSYLQIGSIIFKDIFILVKPAGYRVDHVVEWPQGVCSEVH